MKKRFLFSILIVTLIFVLAFSLLTACDEDVHTTINNLVNEYGAMVEGGAFPDGSLLISTPIDGTSDEGKDAMSAIKDQEYNTFKPVYIFDISVVKDNVKVQPNGKVKVTIPVTANLASYSAVLHIKDEGGVEKLSATYQDSKVSFETDSFSIFVLIEPVLTNIHTHNFSKEWSQSETHHWHACLSENCDAKQDLAEHYYNDSNAWSDEKPATETETGIKVRVCIGCKYVDSQDIPKLDHVHTFSEDWTSDGEYHWHTATCAHTSEISGKTHCSGGEATCTQKAICSICKNEYGDLLSHDFTAKVREEKYLAKPATCQSKSTYYYSCRGCGAKGTETFEDTTGKLAYCTYNEAEICPVCEISAGDWLRFELRADGESYKVTGVKRVDGRSTKIILVPNAYNDKPVVEIADGALYDFDVQHIILSDNVQILGDDCTLSPNLETLTIGKGLRSIKVDSFGYGNGGGALLRQISIADDNQYFKVVDNILYSKDGKTLVKYPAMREGEEFAVDSNVETIWGYAFEGTQKLKSVVIPNNVTEILKWAFYDSRITSIDIGTGVQTISESAFAGSRLKTVKLEGNITTVENKAFYYSYLENVVFGSKVKTIGDYAFCGCSKLTAINIPDNVTKLGMNAFQYTNNVKSVVIGSGIEEIPQNAFDSCANATTNPTLTIGGNVKELGFYAFQGMNIASVTIPASVKIISNSAFRDCSKLASIVIPNTVESLYDACFQDCESLESVTLSNQLTEIPASAFYRCKKLVSITIPNSVKTIGNSAFFACVLLDTINFGTGLTSIGEGAFENCYALNSLTLPSGLEEIKHDAFENCTSLKTVELPSSINKISNVAFVGCDALTSISFNSATDKELYFNYAGTIYTYTFDTVAKTISMLNGECIQGSFYLYSLASYNKDHTYSPITAETKVVKWEDRETA